MFTLRIYRKFLFILTLSLTCSLSLSVSLSFSLSLSPHPPTAEDGTEDLSHARQVLYTEVQPQLTLTYLYKRNSSNFILLGAVLLYPKEV
jgi:hypothetical protein